MAGSLTLVLGGARSGKSWYAEQRAAESGRPVVYLATATAGDGEMAARIALHQQRRPASWRTVEEPLRLAEVIRTGVTGGEVVLIDCLGLWVSNRIFAAIGDRDPDAVPEATWREIEADLLRETASLLAAAAEREIALILVSNEVGLGIVPAYPLGRRYRDLLGQVNRVAAQRADLPILMLAGLPIDLRKLAP